MGMKWNCCDVDCLYGEGGKQWMGGEGGGADDGCWTVTLRISVMRERTDEAVLGVRDDERKRQERKTCHKRSMGGGKEKTDAGDRRIVTQRRGGGGAKSQLSW